MPDREQLFRNDLKLTDSPAGLDLVRQALGDLELARGNENIAQALKLRLQVRKGELAPLGWPEFGSRLHELIGEPFNARTRAMLEAFARLAVERDLRVVKVKKVRAVAMERGAVRINMSVQLIENTPLNLVHLFNLEGK